jgi:hypothetical protein
MRFAAMIVCSATVLLLLAACASSTTSTPEEDSASGVEIPENEYGLEVIDDKDLYLQPVAEDASKELVDLEEEVSGIRLDIRYATEDNFMGEQLYPVAKAVLRKPPRSRSPRFKRSSETRASGSRSSTATARTRLRRRSGNPTRTPTTSPTPPKAPGTIAAVRWTSRS